MSNSLNSFSDESISDTPSPSSLLPVPDEQADLHLGESVDNDDEDVTDFIDAREEDAASTHGNGPLATPSPPAPPDWTNDNSVSSHSSTRENATLKYSRLELDYKTLLSAFTQSKVDLDSKNKALESMAAERDEARAELATMLSGRADVIQKVTVERDALKVNFKNLTEEKEKLKKEVHDLRQRLGECNCLIEGFGHRRGIRSPNKFITKTLESLGDESLRASSLNLNGEIESHKSVQQVATSSSLVAIQKPFSPTPTTASPVERIRRHSIPNLPLQRLSMSFQYITQHMIDETISTPSPAGASVVRERIANARSSVTGSGIGGENDMMSAAKILQDMEEELLESAGNSEEAHFSGSQNSLLFGASLDQLGSLRNLSDTEERKEEVEKNKKAEIQSCASEGRAENRRALFGSMKLLEDPIKAQNPQQHTHKSRPFSSSLRDLGKKWESTTSLLSGERMDKENSIKHTHKSMRHLQAVPTLSDEQLGTSGSLRHRQAQSSRSLLSEEVLPEGKSWGMPR